MKKCIIIFVIFFLFVHILYSELNIYRMNELSLRTLQREIQFTCNYFYRNEEEIDYAELKQIMYHLDGLIPNRYIPKPIYKSRIYLIITDFNFTMVKVGSKVLNEDNDNMVIESLMNINSELKQIIKDKNFYIIDQEAYDKITEEIERLDSIANDNLQN